MMLAFVLAFHALVFLAQPPAQSLSTPASPAGERPVGFTPQELKELDAKVRARVLEQPELFHKIGLAAFLVLLTGFGLNVYFWVRAIGGDPWLRRPADAPSGVSWGFRELLQVFIFLFFVEAAILTLQGLTGAGVGIKKFDRNIFLMINSLLRDVCVAGFVFWVVRRRFHESLEQIGLTLKRFFRNVLVGTLGYLALAPVLIAVLFIVSLTAQLFSYEPALQPVVEIYLKEKQTNTLFFFTLFVAILGPAIEEIFFRGFAYSVFRRRLGAGLAMVSTAVVFAVLHVNLIAFLPIFVLGVFLAYLYEVTGSLVPSMTAHMLHNLIMVCLTLSFKSLAA